MGSQLKLITTIKALENIADQWRALEQICHLPPTVFQSYDWIKCWSEIYLADQSNEHLFVVVGYQSGRLVYVMPLALARKRGVRMLTWLTQPIGQYGDVLCDQKVNVEQWTNAALNFIKSQGEADCLRLRHVRSISNIATYAKNHWHDSTLNERAPAMDLTRFATEGEYDARYDADQRRRRRRIRAKLEKSGVVNYEILTGNEADENIDLALSEKVKWLQERGRYSCAIHSPNHAAFLKALTALKSASIKPITTRLSAGGKPIAWDMGFIYQGTQYQYLTSHVTEFTDLSPGRLAFDLSQRLALSQGVKTYDLMIPYDPHKESWSSGSVAVTDFYAPLTARGAVYSHLYLGLARPILRKIYKSAPKTILRKLQKVFCY